MSSKIFVNLPVKDLPRTKEFFSRLGFTFNAQFTDDTAACMIIGGDNYVMLLTEKKFSEFSKKKIVDASTSTEMVLAVSFESRARVDKIMAAALAAGAVETRPPSDYGFMYQRSFDDPDGHSWEAFHMAESHVQKQ